MKQPPIRPPRTDAHRERDALIARFAALGLQPVVSTNGSIPDADVQIAKGLGVGDVVQCWLTQRGESRLNRRLDEQARSAAKREADFAEQHG